MQIRIESWHKPYFVYFCLLNLHNNYLIQGDKKPYNGLTQRRINNLVSIRLCMDIISVKKVENIAVPLSICVWIHLLTHSPQFSEFFFLFLINLYFRECDQRCLFKIWKLQDFSFSCFTGEYNLFITYNWDLVYGR